MNPLANGLNQVLDATLSTMESVAATCEELQTENSILQQKLAEQERIYLEKVASSRPVLSNDKIDRVLDRLENLHLVPAEWRPKIASQLKADPNAALGLIMQLTDTYMPAHSEGGGIAKSAADHTISDSDPDGWAACARGEDVQVRK